MYSGNDDFSSLRKRAYIYSVPKAELEPSYPYLSSADVVWSLSYNSTERESGDIHIDR